MTCLELGEWLHYLILSLRRVVSQLDYTEHSHADSYIGDLWPAIHHIDPKDGDGVNLLNVVFTLTLTRLNAREDFDYIYRKNLKSSTV
jgi:hypothetical protein